MKQVIFYLLLIPSYFSLMVSCIMSKNSFPVLLTAYLVVFGFYVCYSKKLKGFLLLIEYLNFLIVYPLILGILSNSLSKEQANFDYLIKLGFVEDGNQFMMSFIIGFICCIIILILVKFFTLHREILWFLLLGLTLQTSLFELYLYVNKYLLLNIIFHCILSLLMITTPKSLKIVKINKAQKKKVVEE